LEVHLTTRSFLSHAKTLADALWSPLQQPADAMPPWFDDHKRNLQFRLAVQRQDSLKFGMHGIHCRRRDAEVDDSRAATLDENQPREIAVAR
jgi:hypothetical protein